MIALIVRHREEINGLCRRFGARKLDLFGSAATGGFDPEKSDLDLLVEFGPTPETMNAADQYFGFLEALQTVLGRKVDLVEAPAMRNRFFIREVNRTRVPLYAA